MKQKTSKIINEASAKFKKNTGLNIVHLKSEHHETDSPGVLRIECQNNHWEFAPNVKTRITHATIAIEKTETAHLPEKRILITEYVTPQLADKMKELNIFFIDAAGNAYINSPPLYIFVKGSKLPQKATAPPQNRLFQPSGLKVVFALLNIPELVNRPYREIADITGVALGTVSWKFRNLKEKGYLIEIGKRKRRLINCMELLKRWAEAYPDKLRPDLMIDRFESDRYDWWKSVCLSEHNACWGGEVAAARLTQNLKPAKITIYADKLPGRLIIENRLRKNDKGNIEILKPFWKFETPFPDPEIVPPLLIYSDLIATGDDRNIETAGLIYDKHLVQLDRENR